jgi:hypothetical protein
MRERENGENGERGSLPLTRCSIQSCHARESESRGRGSREQHKRQSVWESLLSGPSRGRGSGIGAGAYSRDESEREESESRERESHERRGEERERRGREQRERRGERRALLLGRSEQRTTESLPEADRGRSLPATLSVQNDESVDKVKCHERGERESVKEQREERRA